MKLLKKVKPIEVKRAFIISDFVRRQFGESDAMKRISRAQYGKRLRDAKKILLPVSEKILDIILAREWRPRLAAYDSMQWYIAEADTREIGVWRAAGHLPLKWTKGNLEQTGEFVAHALKKNPKSLKRRSFSAIPGILKTSLPYLQREKYLFPIAFKGGTGTKGRKGLPRMKGDLDDGCMRSVALAVSGKKKIKVYFGMPKKRRR